MVVVTSMSSQVTKITVDDQHAPFITALICVVVPVLSLAHRRRGTLGIMSVRDQPAHSRKLAGRRICRSRSSGHVDRLQHIYPIVSVVSRPVGRMRKGDNLTRT